MAETNGMLHGFDSVAVSGPAAAHGLLDASALSEVHANAVLDVIRPCAAALLAA